MLYRNVLIVALATAGLVGCQPTINNHLGVFNLQSEQKAEVCSEIEAGSKLTISFSSDQPVDFNLHYHNADKTSYLNQTTDSSLLESTSFDIKVTETYCLMWIGKNKASKVTYKYHITN